MYISREKTTKLFCPELKDPVMRAYTVRVKTGDRKDAGTDANVKIRLYDEEGKETKDIKLDVIFRDDFEEGKLDEFHIQDDASLSTKINKIAISRDNAGDWLKSADWYVEYIEVEVDETREFFVFPINRWIHADRQYLIQQYDVVLPQDDPHKEQRAFELAEKKKLYEYDQKAPGIPVQVKRNRKSYCNRQSIFAVQQMFRGVFLRVRFYYMTDVHFVLSCFVIMATLALCMYLQWQGL
jgi:hypothetical protein